MVTLDSTGVSVSTVIGDATAQWTQVPATTWDLVTTYAGMLCWQSPEPGV
jgi:hypothetical protein